MFSLFRVELPVPHTKANARFRSVGRSLSLHKLVQQPRPDAEGEQNTEIPKK